MSKFTSTSFKDCELIYLSGNQNSDRKRNIHINALGCCYRNNLNQPQYSLLKSQQKYLNHAINVGAKLLQCVHVQCTSVYISAARNCCTVYMNSLTCGTYRPLVKKKKKAVAQNTVVPATRAKHCSQNSQLNVRISLVSSGQCHAFCHPLTPISLPTDPHFKTHLPQFHYPFTPILTSTLPNFTTHFRFITYLPQFHDPPTPITPPTYRNFMTHLLPFNHPPTPI